MHLSIPAIECVLPVQRVPSFSDSPAPDIVPMPFRRCGLRTPYVNHGRRRIRIFGKVTPRRYCCLRTGLKCECTSSESTHSVCYPTVSGTSVPKVVTTHQASIQTPVWLYPARWRAHLLLVVNLLMEMDQKLESAKLATPSPSLFYSITPKYVSTVRLRQLYTLQSKMLSITGSIECDISISWRRSRNVMPCRYSMSSATWVNF